jgi:hypothetical protein
MIDWTSLLRDIVWVCVVNTRVRDQARATVHRARALRVEAKLRRHGEAKASPISVAVPYDGDTAKVLSQLDFARVRR